MKNKAKSLKANTDNLSKISNKQEKNRLWWETLPMTYADWDSENRTPETKEDFLEIESLLLNGSKFLKNKFNFNAFAGKKVLEIGCGSGAASCLFAKGGAEVTCVDITENAIKLTKTNAKAQGLSVNAQRQDAEKLDFKDENFDYVFSWGVLHHSNNTINAFKQVYRVLKKNGSGLIMVYNKNSLRYYINGLYWLLFKGKLFSGYNLKSVQDFYTDGYYHRHFTPRELKKILESIGLKCNKITVTHMNTIMIPFLPKNIVEWMKRKWGWLLVAEFVKL
ncbi:MAG: class I SAM-dependent methyltransferase [Candidatus Pacearchaeota archaeon]